MTEEKKNELKEKREEAQKWLRLGRVDFAFLILEAINNGASISSIRGLATDEMAGVEVRTCQAADIVIPDRCTCGQNDSDTLSWWPDGCPIHKTGQPGR